MSEPRQPVRRIDSSALSPEERKAEVLAVKSDQMAFEISRTNRQPNRTFSKEALDELLESVTQFIATRVAHHMEGEEFMDRGHMTARVDVQVTIDGQSWTVPDDISPWYRIDGTVREAAIKNIPRGANRKDG